MTVDNSNQPAFEIAPEQLAEDSLAAFHSSGQYPSHVVERLIDLSLIDDAKTSELASRAFFTGLVERLSDSFEPRAVSFYNRAFACLIERARKTPRGAAIDRELKRFNLLSENDLLTRAEALRRVQPVEKLRNASSNIRRVIVLSRVTLGADVAITSVIIERVKHEFPEAEIILVGGRKASELFGGEHRLSFQEVRYSRTASAIDKLLSWPDVLAVMTEAINGFKRGEYLIVDPDSRLTQLGLLPVAHSENAPCDYLFFPSREYGSGTHRSLGELTSLWLDEVFGQSERIHPQVSLNGGDVDKAEALIKRMRNGAGPIVTINFGVGENPAKRVGKDFEKSLVYRLLESGAMVILDKGAGEEESMRADSIIKSAKMINAQGRAISIVEADESNLDALINSEKLEVDLLVWSGRIGLLAAMIGASDLYIGYDSAGQHIAAAMCIPCIDVFAGYSSPRMLDRWRPAGRAEARVIAVDSSRPVDESAVLADTLEQAMEIVGSKQKAGDRRQ